MEAQQKLLADHFEKLGAKVEFQRFRAKHPSGQGEVPMANLIVRWNPDRKERILLCAHYDTLPYPMRDPVDRQGVFVGANDGGSGVALLMELGREIAQGADSTLRDAPVGIDFVFFDGEEYIFDERDEFFLGSSHFAREYVRSKPPYRYRWGVLLDMVGDRDLQIFEEQHSVRWRDTRPLVGQIWGTAARLGVRDFIPAMKYDIRDDHVPLHDIGKIPVCDIIDFDYPAWHTRADTVEQCSALSLAKVGWVLQEWLKTAVR